MIAHILAVAHSDPKRAKPDITQFMYKDAETRREEQLAAADKFFFKAG